MLYIIAQAIEHNKQIRIASPLLDKHANTEEPYKKTFSIGVFPTTAAAPITGIPVPKMKHRAIEIPNLERKIILIKV